jgi:hypothetical protein
MQRSQMTRFGRPADCDAAAHRKFQALHKETSVNADPFRPNLALSGSDRAMRHECAMRESAFARSMRHGFFPLGHSVIMAHSVCATDAPWISLL